MKTFKHGGVHPPENKITKDVPIETIPVPGQIIVPLFQHLGKPAKAVVKPRDPVKKGQLIGEANGFVSSNIHAPTSGIVKAIGRHPSPAGQYVEAVTIDSDGKDEWVDGLNSDEIDFKNLSKEQIIKKIQDSGIVGMGGAGFPTHVKLSPPKDKKIDVIILNGAECEPYLTADHRLMLENPQEVLKGLAIVASLFESSTKVYIGIENNKQDVIQLLREHAFSFDFEVVPLKVKYPQGSEKQLINAITGRHIEEGELPFDKGCLVHNIATAFAIYEAVCLNKPLIERVLTASGMEIRSKKNIKATIGTKFSDIMEFCDGLVSEDMNQLICGGPMMGKAQYTFDVPVSKTTSGLLFINNKELDTLRERPCLRCGRCIEVCPQNEAPWILADKAQKQQPEILPSYGLNDCMECGSCAYVCPAKREIVHWIKYSKAVNINQKQKEAQKK